MLKIFGRVMWQTHDMMHGPVRKTCMHAACAKVVKICYFTWQAACVQLQRTLVRALDRGGKKLGTHHQM